MVMICVNFVPEDFEKLLWGIEPSKIRSSKIYRQIHPENWAVLFKVSED